MPDPPPSRSRNGVRRHPPDRDAAIAEMSERVYGNRGESFSCKTRQGQEDTLLINTPEQKKKIGAADLWELRNPLQNLPSSNEN